MLFFSFLIIIEGNYANEQTLEPLHRTVETELIGKYSMFTSFVTLILHYPIHRVKKGVLIKEYLEDELKVIDLCRVTMALTLRIRKILLTDDMVQSILMFNLLMKNKLFNCGF